MIGIINNSVSEINYKSGISFKAKPFKYDEALRIKNRMLSFNTYDVYSHTSPDEDTINAAKVIIRKLKEYGKQASLCVNKRKARCLFFSHGNNNFKHDANPADLAIVLDFNARAKIPSLYKEIFNATDPEKIIGFDHHEKTTDPIRADLYSDNTAKSCCSILYRYFEALGEKLSKNDLKSLYCGMLSDYKKSKLVDFKDSKLIKLPALEDDKNSKEVLERVEAQLSDKAKVQIYKHLDVISNLTPKEQSLRKRLVNDIQVTPNGKLAYIIIPVNDKQWHSMGLDTTRNSQILSDLRLRLINDVQNDGLFSPEQKEKLKNVQAVIMFYGMKTAYKMSVHSKDDYAMRIIDYVIETTKPAITPGGHPNRAGGRIASLDKNDVDNFIKGYLTAAEKIDW